MIDGGFVGGIPMLSAIVPLNSAIRKLIAHKKHSRAILQLLSSTR